MPLSLRLDSAIESNLLATSARLGITKTALIHRGIERVLEEYAETKQLTAYERYLKIMNDPKYEEIAEPEYKDYRPHKVAIKAAVRTKLEKRSIGSPK